MKMRPLIAIAALGLCMAAGAGPVLGQEFPTRPIRFVLGLAPGGGADISARIMAQKASEIIGQQVVVENRPGAGGNIAAESVAKAAPDGYTLFQTTVAQPISRRAYRNLGYDYLKDFVAIADLGAAGFAMMVPNELPVKTAAEFVAYAKANPGKLNFGSSGNGTPSHLAGELFKTLAGIEMQHVPYKGMGPAITDLLSNRIQVTFGALPSALPLLKSGRARVIAVTGARRSALAPDLPTVDESGVPGFSAETWFGALAPAATPMPIVEKLAAAFSAAAKDPGVRAKMREQGFDLHDRSREDYGAFLRAETEKWSKVVEATGTRID